MLHAMFSGRFDTKPSEDGSYFIDRDGTHFRYILNYLRTAELIVPEDKIVRRELLAEAKFYQVQGIINELTVEPYNGPFRDSVILSSDQCQTFTNWLKETPAFTNASDKLLYRASRDGWTAANFHSCCDNKGPTVTVVKSGNYIFGGYTDHQWGQGKAQGSVHNLPILGGRRKCGDYSSIRFRALSAHVYNSPQFKHRFWCPHSTHPFL